MTANYADFQLGRTAPPVLAAKATALRDRANQAVADGLEKASSEDLAALAALVYEH